MICGASARAAAIALVLAIAAAPAAAVEPPGSKNFNAPRDVPNYFSNEAGAINGGASAHAGAPAYPTYATPVPSQAARAYAIAPRSYAARTAARGRYRAVHGRSRGYLQARRGGRAPVVHFAHARAAVHGRPAGSHGRVASAAGHRVARR